MTEQSQLGGRGDESGALVPPLPCLEPAALVPSLLVCMSISLLVRAQVTGEGFSELQGGQRL